MMYFYEIAAYFSVNLLKTHSTYLAAADTAVETLVVVNALLSGILISLIPDTANFIFLTLMKIKAIIGYGIVITVFNR